MSKKAVYDEFAKEYQESKQLPFRIYIERYMIFNLLGDLRGKTVLDLACGEGIYSRQIKALGAEKVTGIDISSEMVNLGRAEEQRHPLGVDYVVGDASNYEHSSRTDSVLGSYLLNYAKTWEEILAFCQTIFNNLKPGGKFVGFNDNPANRPEDFDRYRSYGFYKTTPENRKEGDPITYHILTAEGGEFSFNNYYLSKETYERAFTTVGFKDFTWHSAELAPGASEKFPPGFWDDFLRHPPMVAMSATRPV